MAELLVDSGRDSLGHGDSVAVPDKDMEAPVRRLVSDAATDEHGRFWPHRAAAFICALGSRDLRLEALLQIPAGGFREMTRILVERASWRERT